MDSEVVGNEIQCVNIVEASTTKKHGKRAKKNVTWSERADGY